MSIIDKLAAWKTEARGIRRRLDSGEKLTRAKRRCLKQTLENLNNKINEAERVAA